MSMQRTELALKLLISGASTSTASRVVDLPLLAPEYIGRLVPPLTLSTALSIDQTVRALSKHDDITKEEACQAAHRLKPQCTMNPASPDCSGV